MEPAIAWAIGIGSCIFGLGMISAIGSRRQRKQKAHTDVTPIEQPEIIPTKKKDDPSGGMRMAASGSGNVSPTEDEFAAKFGPTLAGAGQGSKH
jgi:hypothetical protein